MARVSEITYTHIEVLKLLLKDQGIEEGQWMLVMNFGFKAMNMPSQVGSELSPGSLVVVNHLGVKRIDGDSPVIPGLTVDAGTGEPVGTMEALEAASDEV